MELRVERDALAEAVVWTARSLPARPPMQVLLGLLLETTDAGLSVSGFDYEVSSQISVSVTTAEPGRVLVPGRLLSEIVRSLPPQHVDLRLEGSRLVLTCGAARFTLPTLPVEDYPALPAMPTTAGALESDVFGAAVAQVALAAGRDDTLPVLTGVRIEIEGDQLTLAATDRYRLAVRTLQWKPEQPDLSATALVPARTLADTAKALTSGPEVTLALSTGGAGEGMIGFEGVAHGTGRRTTSRLLEGEFPKYRSLLPSESSSHAEVETAPFVEAVKRVSLVAAVRTTRRRPSGSSAAGRRATPRRCPSPSTRSTCSTASVQSTATPPRWPSPARPGRPSSPGSATPTSRSPTTATC
jgi:DNA polymerase-3 subunit beta